MTQVVSAAIAKARLAALVGAVAFRGEHFIIERRGRPVAALVSVGDLERLERPSPEVGEFRGFLPLVGAWEAISDAEIDQVVADIYAARAADQGRVVDLDK